MSSVDTSNLQALAENSKLANKFALGTRVQPEVLERFDNPTKDVRIVGQLGITNRVLIKQPEFTSLCPMTGQPDFATIVIEYEPDQYCVESKSLKLYLMSFRNVGEFHEACVARICHDLAALLKPYEMTVRGEFTPRGGIPFWPTAYYHRAGDKTMVG